MSADLAITPAREQVDHSTLPLLLWHLAPFHPAVLGQDTISLKWVYALGRVDVCAWPEQPRQAEALHGFPGDCDALAMALLMDASTHFDLAFQTESEPPSVISSAWNKGGRAFSDMVGAAEVRLTADRPVLTVVARALLKAWLRRAATTPTSTGGTHDQD